MEFKNYDLERSVIACCLYDEEAAHKTIVQLTEHDFEFIPTKTIYQAITGLFRASKNVDLINVNAQLESMDMLNKIGGIQFITGLVNEISTAAGIQSYIDSLKELTHRRMIIEHIRTVHVAVKTETDIKKVYNALSNLPSFENNNYQHKTTKQILQGAVDRVGERFETDKVIPGLSTGFRDIDKIVGGLRKGEITLITADPNVGKSILAEQISEHVAKTGQHAHVFNYEMTEEQIADRMLIQNSGLEAIKIQIPKDYMEDKDLKVIEALETDMLDRYLHVHPAEEFVAGTVAELEIKLREAKVKAGRGASLVLVDYLQLMSGGGSGEDWERAGKNFQALKKLTQRLGCATIVIASKNKDDKIRGSNQIQYDADGWWDMKREHDADTPEERSSTELRIKKNRSGGKGKIDLVFVERFIKFAGVAY